MVRDRDGGPWRKHWGWASCSVWTEPVAANFKGQCFLKCLSWRWCLALSSQFSEILARVAVCERDCGRHPCYDLIKPLRDATSSTCTAGVSNNPRYWSLTVDFCKEIVSKGNCRWFAAWLRCHGNQPSYSQNLLWDGFGSFACRQTHVFFFLTCITNIYTQRLLYEQSVPKWHVYGI